MAIVPTRPGSHASYMFNGPANLRELEDTNLSGAHLHFNGPFDLRDLVAVDLRNTTLIINDYQGIPPCSGCVKASRDGQASLLGTSAILPPTSDSQISSAATDILQPRSRKRLRREPSEDGELGPSSPASRQPTIKPLPSELHPDRVAMLRDPSPEVEAQTVKIISRTKANCLEMPFNRLEQRQLQRAMTHFSTSTNSNTGRSLQDRMRVRAEGQRSMLAEEAESVADREERNEARVDSFLRTLESDVPALSQQSERFGRLSPVPDSNSEIPETPAPSASPTRLQLEAELETFVLREHGGAQNEVAVKSEMEL